MPDLLECKITEQDIFGTRITAVSPEHFTTRETVRVVPIDPLGRIAVVNARLRGIHLVVGGGIEEDDKDQLAALRREVLEEIGCVLIPDSIKKIGVIREQRDATKEVYVSHCYMAKITKERKGTHYTLKERLQGCRPEWIKNITTAVNIFKTNKPWGWDYKGHFVSSRDRLILEQVQKNMSKNPVGGTE